MVVTTAPRTLQEAYERSLASETFLSTRTGLVAAAPPPLAQLDVRSGGDGRRKSLRQWRSRNRAQSVGKSKEEIRRIENTFWSVGRPDRLGINVWIDDYLVYMGKLPESSGYSPLDHYHGILKEVLEEGYSS
ncbi:hypothetical protein Scep_003732 [Stephania cephalantha]|uniref:Uncharacterized protein n=1 Tax=Stephania cephalantha TaxID=152367 RepID=A0AAP0KSK0_9MAGN